MRRAVTALGVALTACAPAASPQHRGFLEELRAAPSAFVAETAAARGERAPSVPIFLDDDAAFAIAVRQKLAHDALPSLPSDTVAFALAFDLDEQPTTSPGRAGSVTGDALTDEQLLGFYDQVTREIHVRSANLRRDEAERPVARFVLAHELGHALQHQRMGARISAAPPTDDARLAWGALLEGDASLTALAHLAVRRRWPLGRVVARLGDVARAAQVNGLAAETKSNEVLARAPALERERLLFPYEAGLAFVSDLHRAGGLALVERAFVEPPTTTEQVLSPRRYLDGEQAVPVELPPTPSGAVSVVAGTAGQLLIGVALGRCSSRAEARQAAEGWGGDAYRIVTDDGGRLGLLWATTWDDEASAQRFEAALSSPCLRHAARSEGLSVSPRTTVARSGRHVAVVRGLGDTPHEPLISALHAAPRAPLPARPIAAGLTIPPVRPRPVVGPWLRAMTSWDSPYLGLRVPAWPGFVAESGDAPTTLTLKGRERGALMLLVELSDEPTTTASQAALFDGVAAALGRATRSSMRVVSNGTLPTSLGLASARTFAVPETSIRLRVAALPVCRATGTIVISALWSDEQGRRAADAFVVQLSTLGQDRPPVCDELDP